MKPNIAKTLGFLKAIGIQLILCIGSTVTGIITFWLLFLIISSSQGGMALDDLFFIIAMLFFFIATGTLIFPFYFLSLLAIKFLKPQSITPYSALGLATAFLGSCFNWRLKLYLHEKHWEIYALIAVAGAAAGFFHGYFDLKYSKKKRQS